jgi:hypothetical protein
MDRSPVEKAVRNSQVLPDPDRVSGRENPNAEDWRSAIRVLTAIPVSGGDPDAEIQIL